MLDWTNRFRRPGASGNATTAGTSGRNPLLLALAVLIGLYLLVMLVIGWYWSREPDLFPVQQHVREAAEGSQRQIVKGYTTVETLKRVASTLLDKPGGYLTNDIAPPGLWLDNMPS